MSKLIVHIKAEGFSNLQLLYGLFEYILNEFTFT